MGFATLRSAWRMQQDSPPSCQPRIRSRSRRRPGRSWRWCVCVCACVTFFPRGPCVGVSSVGGGDGGAAAALNNGAGRGRPPGGSGRGQCILPARAKADSESAAPTDVFRRRRLAQTQPCGPGRWSLLRLSSRFFSLQAALYFFSPPAERARERESG